MIRGLYQVVRGVVIDLLNPIREVNELDRGFYCNPEPTEAEMIRTRKRFDREVARRDSARDLASSVS